MEKELVEYLSLILPDFSQSCIDIMGHIFQLTLHFLHEKQGYEFLLLLIPH